MLLVWRMRHDSRLMETRALVQSITFAGQQETDKSDVDSLNAAWKDYTDEMFPFQRGRIVKQDQSAIDFLKQEVAKGPLRVKPLQYLGKARSRLHRRRSDAEAMSRLKQRYGAKR